MRHATVTFLLLAWVAACGGISGDVDDTVATLTPVRGEAQLDEERALSQTRASTGASVRTNSAGLARLSLDAGPRLLLDADTELVLSDDAVVTLSRGRLFAELAPGEALEVDTEHGSLRGSDASFSVRTADGATEVYVVRGELVWTRPPERGLAAAGERLTLRADAAEVTPATLWHDWTGGLARPGPADAGGPEGVGMLEARVPDEVGRARWPLVVRRLDVRVRVQEDLAVTEVDQLFFNPASETVEGLYRIRVPEGAVLQRFAVDRDTRLVDGYVREKSQARQAYESQVYRGSTDDPALLEWDAPGSYRARIYPIAPGETRRIVIRYAEWLRRPAGRAVRLYRYPMGGGARTPRIQEFALAVDLTDAGAEQVRAGMGARVERGAVRIRRSDFTPRSDFWLELVGGGGDVQRAWTALHEPPARAPGTAVTNEADERDYFYLPLVLPTSLAGDGGRGGLDLVVLADVSAATDRSHLELGRSVVESLTAHLGPSDRVAVVTSDLTIRNVIDGDAQLGEATPERVERLLDGLARVPSGGATDLGEALAAAAALLEAEWPARAAAVVYVGDGAPTVGELRAQGLLERLSRLPSPLRLYAVGVGSDANLDLLSTLTRGGGLALRVEERAQAAGAALRLLEHVERPVAHHVEVELGTGIENVFPRRPMDAVLGEVFPVVGRVRDSLPDHVTVRGMVAGRAFEERIEVEVEETEESTDLRLRWAAERLRQLLLEGAGREEVAELGTRYGLITPYTSYYVPSRRELAQMGGYAARWIDRPLLAVGDTRASEAAQFALAVALGPLSIAGCSYEHGEASSTEAVVGSVPMEEAVPPGAPQASPVVAPEPPADEATEEAADEGGDVGANRYGLRADEQAAAPAPPVRARPEAAGSPAAEALDPWAGDDPAPTSAASHAGASGQLAGQPGGSVEGTIDLETLGLGDLGREDPGGDDDERTRSSSARRPEVRTGSVDVRGAEPRDYVRRVGDRAAHRSRRCSDAADLRLEDRVVLWNERLANERSAAGWVGGYRSALAQCEAPTWRDRRAFLQAILARAGTIENMVQVYRLLSDASSRSFLRARILRRVRTPQDLRQIRRAFGMANEVDWALVDQILERAPTDGAKARALRRLSMQYPQSFELKLRLLSVLERSERDGEAKRLADDLRADSLADQGVRTAIGEMFLRMGREDEARRVFSELVEFAPLDELARRRLGDLYRAHGWFDDAYRQYQTLSEIRPDDPDVLLLLAQAAAGAGRVDEALRLERRLMQTAQPGASRGVARTALLWSSVRFARLQHAAHGNTERLEALARRRRRSGVLREAAALRVTLVWSHPDAQIGLWAGLPGLSPSRPTDIVPEHGIEAFQLEEQEPGTYRFEVRRTAAEDNLTEVGAQLVIVWNEGADDERIELVDLTFDREHDAYAWELIGRTLTAIIPGGGQ